MKRAAILICLALFAPACGEEAAENSDLSVAGGSCAAILACIQSTCTSASTYGTCTATCAGMGTPAAQAKYAPITACVGQSCVSAVDGGAPACADPTAASCSACAQTQCTSQLAACTTN